MRPKLKRIILAAILIAAFGFDASVSGAELAVPTIEISPDVYYPFDEVLYLEGTAAPNGLIQVRLQKSGSRPQTFNVKSQSNGEWVLAQKLPLAAGSWEVRARLLSDETSSLWSNPRVFKVVVSGVTIGGVDIKFAWLTLFIVVLLLAGGGFALYFYFRIRRLRRALLAKEVGEVQESVRQGLTELRHQILEELRLFESSRKRLSPDDLARKEHLLRELDRIERDIEREIKDIV